MNISLVLGLSVVILFLLAFFTKRRFGVLGLALAAGAMLSSLWAETLTPIIEQAGVSVQAPPLLTLVSIGLVLLPALLLLFSGPSYKELIPRLLGAILFATFSTALLIEPFGSTLILEGQDKVVYNVLFEYRVYIVTAGLIIALIDLLWAKTPNHHKSSKH